MASKALTSLTAAVVIHHGIGDVVMALPMLAALDENLPSGSRLVLVVKSPLEAEIVSRVRWRSNLRVLQIGKDRSFGALGGLVSVALAIRRERPDVLLCPHMTARLNASAFARLAGAPIAVGPEGPWRRLGFSKGIVEAGNEHKVNYYARFAIAAGLLRPETPLSYPRLSDSGTSPGQTETRLIVLAPGSGEVERHKRWEPALFARLAGLLMESDPGLRIVVFGGRHELPLLNHIHSAIGDRERSAVVAASTLEDSLALLGNAACVVGGCSGTLHIAALLDRPIVGLYGPTNPSFTGPYASAVRIVRLGLDCSPCYRIGFIKGCGEPICMTAISPERVFAAVRETISGKGFETRHAIATKRLGGPSAEDRARAASLANGSGCEV